MPRPRFFATDMGDLCLEEGKVDLEEAFEGTEEA
jgi:hypothetical protein